MVLFAIGQKVLAFKPKPCSLKVAYFMPEWQSLALAMTLVYILSMIFPDHKSGKLCSGITGKLYSGITGKLCSGITGKLWTGMVVNFAPDFHWQTGEKSEK